MCIVKPLNTGHVRDNSFINLAIRHLWRSCPRLEVLNVLKYNFRDLSKHVCHKSVLSLELFLVCYAAKVHPRPVHYRVFITELSWITFNGHQCMYSPTSLPYHKARTLLCTVFREYYIS